MRFTVVVVVVVGRIFRWFVQLVVVRLSYHCTSRVHICMLHAAAVLRLLMSTFWAVLTPWQCCRFGGLGLFYRTYIYRPLPEYAEQRRSMMYRYVYRHSAAAAALCVLLYCCCCCCFSLMMLFVIAYLPPDCSSYCSTYYHFFCYERKPFSTPLGSTLAFVPPRLTYIAIPFTATTGMHRAAGGRPPAASKLPLHYFFFCPPIIYRTCSSPTLIEYTLIPVNTQYVPTNSRE